MNIYPVETVAYFTSTETSSEWHNGERTNYLENEGTRYENLTGVRKILVKLFR